MGVCIYVHMHVDPTVLVCACVCMCTHVRVLAFDDIRIVNLFMGMHIHACMHMFVYL